MKSIMYPVEWTKRKRERTAKRTNRRVRSLKLDRPGSAEPQSKQEDCTKCGQLLYWSRSGGVLEGRPRRMDKSKKGEVGNMDRTKRPIPLSGQSGKCKTQNAHKKSA